MLDSAVVADDANGNDVNDEHAAAVHEALVGAVAASVVVADDDEHIDDTTVDNALDTEHDECGVDDLDDEDVRVDDVDEEDPMELQRRAHEVAVVVQCCCWRRNRWLEASWQLRYSSC